MGIKQILVDDLDGRDLPADTQPVEVTFDGKKHKVYMSARNTERFHDFLTGVAPLVGQQAAPVRRSSSTADTGSKRSPEELAKVREWAAANGHTVGEKGRIAGKVLEAYDAAH